ncbi:HAD family hydrolase [Flammeovirga sp. EKP202]|uniref:HAD family hydrolase n=1 Tax=Flammeovirga sp. EKP202 TaxID=2770592 RepID=UPI00165F5AB2|nr:HAD family hydrolase [Flammeovirga sp. EKP202]MBD0405407.1 HAD family hydrolase [Flammeovirga sp. EKP202]
MKNNIKVIAFDADDTLWVNEPYFQEAEEAFCQLLGNDLPKEEISKELFRVEMRNLPLYGYGIKGFVLCMIETAKNFSKENISNITLQKILELGHELLEKPIELLEGVPETLETLKEEYQLIVATKGDLLDQERKLQKSGLERYFHHIEIMSDKKERDYQKLLQHLDCQPENFLMIGNSMKSDILPVLEIGGNAAYVPYHTTWAHEKQEIQPELENLIQLNSIQEITHHLKF